VLTPEQLERVLASVTDGITIQDQAGRLVYANDAAAQLMLYPSVEALLAAPEQERFAKFDIYDETGKPLPHERLPGRLVREGSVPSAEITVRIRIRSSGELRWRVLRAIPVRDGNGRVQFVIHLFHDITERKRAEETQRFLAEASRLLASSLDFTATLRSVARLAVAQLADYCIVDVAEPDGAIRRVVVTHADPKKQELAQRLEKFPPAPDRPGPVAEALRTGQARLYTGISEPLLQASTTSAEHLELMRQLAPRMALVVPLVARGHTLGALSFAVAESGRVYGAADMALAEELAQRAAIAVDNARLYEDAQDALRAREDFVAVVSHELKNPLSAVLMDAGLLRRMAPEGAGGERQRKHAERIERSAQEAARLIKDLLDLARMEVGALPLERRSCLVAPLIGEVLEMLQPLATQKAQKLERDSANELSVDCDRDRVRQVLSNLVGNAIKFTPAGGAIGVRVQPRDGQAVFVVEDSGPGIPPDQLGHIFDRYWQGRGGDNSERGVGLGLSIAKAIVEAHGGRIWAESRVGSGSRFYFTLSVALA